MSTHNKTCSNQIKYSTRRCGQKLWSLIFFDQALNHKIRFYSNKQNIIFFSFFFQEKFFYRKFLDYLFCTTLILFNINKIHRLTLLFLLDCISWCFSTVALTHPLPWNSRLTVWSRGAGFAGFSVISRKTWSSRWPLRW